MTAERKLGLKFFADDSQVKRAFGSIGSAGGRMRSGVGSAFRGMATAATVFTGAVGGAVLVGKNLADASADLSEAQSKAAQIFGDSSDIINTFGEDAARQFGLSERAATDFSSSFGQLLKKSGLGSDVFAGMSTDLTGLTGDLASFNNIASDDVAAKLFAGLGGESEPLKALGIFINAAAVEARGLEMGLGDVNGVMSEAEKVQARYALIMEQTADAHGDFARTASGLPNIQRTLGAQWENMKATLGEKLAPAFAKVIGLVSEKMPGMIDWIGPRLSAAFDSMGAKWEEHGPAVIAGFESFMEKAGEVVGWVVDNWPQISAKIGEVLDRAATVIGAFVETAQTYWREWGDETIAVALKTWEALGVLFDTGAKVLVQSLEAFSLLFEGEWGDLWSKIEDIAKVFNEGIYNVVSGLFEDLAEKLFNAGVELIQQLWDGMKSKWADVQGWLAGVADSLVGWIPGVDIGGGSKATSTIGSDPFGGDVVANVVSARRERDAVDAGFNSFGGGSVTQNITVVSNDPQGVVDALQQAQRQGLMPELVTS